MTKEELELQALQGELNLRSARPLGSGTKMPSLEMMEAAKGGSPNPDAAMMKMHIRDRIKAMLALGRRNTEQFANLYSTDTLPQRMMEQRFIDPREYGAHLPPNAPQIGRSQGERLNPHSTKMRWIEQMIDHMRRSTENLESGAPTAPPQFTGRFRDRIAF